MDDGWLRMLQFNVLQFISHFDAFCCATFQDTIVVEKVVHIYLLKIRKNLNKKKYQYELPNECHSIIGK